MIRHEPTIGDLRATDARPPATVDPPAPGEEPADRAAWPPMDKFLLGCLILALAVAAVLALRRPASGSMQAPASLPIDPSVAAPTESVTPAPRTGAAAVDVQNALAALRAGRVRSARNWAWRARTAGGDTAAVAELTALVRARTRPMSASPVATMPSSKVIRPRATTGARAGARADALVSQADAALAAGNTSEANALLVRAAHLDPTLPALQGAVGRLAQAVAATASTAAPAGASSVATPAISTLLARAANAAQAGEIASPPGASAYDLYQQALALDGRNQQALAGLRGLPAVAVSECRQALGAGDYRTAASLVRQIGEIDPADPDLPALQQAVAVPPSAF